ncbi:uncharacterized protein LOC131169239 isoform X2 [Hevea brasiliensis]|uniref:uncharacterized protein LOC131169239 isoform X2 n=1 Tax=Hevea brasiliensis TaxID=3981 RepID=UPI0025F13878|nr:uncharacterized protein LOC131169239 isoform X2 [Hevea brasiliensis]
MTVLSCQEMPQKSHCEVVSLVQESICFAMLITSTCLNMNSIWTQLQFTLQRKPCGHNSDANMAHKQYEHCSEFYKCLLEIGKR